MGRRDKLQITVILIIVVSLFVFVSFYKLSLDTSDRNAFFECFKPTMKEGGIDSSNSDHSSEGNNTDNVDNNPPKKRNIFTTDNHVGCNEYGCFGQWLGNTYVPATGRMFSSPEISSIFDGRCVVLLGDSLTRRLAATLSIFLGAQHSSSDTDVHWKDLNDGKLLSAGFHSKYNYNVTIPCLSFKWAPSVTDVENYLIMIGENEEGWNDYTDIIIGIGVHDAVHMEQGLIEEGLVRVFDLLSNNERLGEMDIVWRTAPYAGGKPKSANPTNEKVRLLNSYARREFGKVGENVRMLDLEAIMETKSWGDDRVGVDGDTVNHFSVEARVAFIQALVNVML
ncbi:hypothetical protein TrCOL_g5172 [Triparma columacea]|uniref:Uncharacterized protein n=1 Tax=Triparma columacea TaxID=722753 RepID=A0A9W7GF33_9STRA|nr:hypothetical protein TrCOL_g5172 [Triparma columacea]